MTSSEDPVPDLIGALRGVPDRLAKQALEEILRLRAMLPHVPVNPGARHTPANKGDGGLPPDVTRPDNGEATSGRGHFEDSIARRMRQTRADMLGTDDEQHYWDCQDAATEIERLKLTDEERETIGWFSRLSYGDGGRMPTYCATLRALLERTK